MADASESGAWVDGIAVSVAEADATLWQRLTRADSVTVVLSDGVTVPCSVTLVGMVAREMLGRALNVGAGRSTGAGGEI